MPYFASPATNPLNVTWIVPISAPTVRPLDGVYTQTAIDSLGMAELTQQLQAIAARPGANLTLAPDPSLLDTLSDLADGFELVTQTGKQRVPAGDLTARAAATLLDQLRRGAQAAGEIAAVPYVPADFPTLAQRNGGIELEQRQAIGLLERGQYPHQAVSVRVGFDDGEHLRPRGKLARTCEIRGQCRQVDLREKRTRHAAEMVQ